MAKRTAAYAVSTKTQKLFIGLVLLAVLLQLATILYWLIRQYPTNHNLSSYLVITVEGVLVPVLFFVTAYWLRRRSGGFMNRIFDAAFFAAMGVVMAGLISSSTIFYQQLYIFNGGYWRSILYTLAPTAFGYILFLAFLLRYKD